MAASSPGLQPVPPTLPGRIVTPTTQRQFTPLQDLDDEQLGLETIEVGSGEVKVDIVASDSKS